MFAWVKSFFIVAETGPAYNVTPELLVEFRSKLKAPSTVVAKPPHMSGLQMLLAKAKLRHVSTLPRPTTFLPKHPVMRQIALGEYKLRPLTSSK